jgi:hypothetical protein
MERGGLDRRDERDEYNTGVRSRSMADSDPLVARNPEMAAARR